MDLRTLYWLEHVWTWRKGFLAGVSGGIKHPLMKIQSRSRVQLDLDVIWGCSSGACQELMKPATLQACWVSWPVATTGLRKQVALEKPPFRCSSPGSPLKAPKCWEQNSNRHLQHTISITSKSVMSFQAWGHEYVRAVTSALSQGFETFWDYLSVNPLTALSIYWIAINLPIHPNNIITFLNTSLPSCQPTNRPFTVQYFTMTIPIHYLHLKASVLTCPHPRDALDLWDAQDCLAIRWAPLFQIAPNSTAIGAVWASPTTIALGTIAAPWGFLGTKLSRHMSWLISNNLSWVSWRTTFFKSKCCAVLEYDIYWLTLAC